MVPGEADERSVAIAGSNGSEGSDEGERKREQARVAVGCSTEWRCTSREARAACARPSKCNAQTHKVSRQ